MTGAIVNGKIYVIGGRVGAAFISAGSSNVDIPVHTDSHDAFELDAEKQ